jgi:hypothetical protein
LAALTLAGEQCCHEVAEHAAMLVVMALSDKQHYHKAAEHAAAQAELVLAGEHCNRQQQRQK